MGVIVKPHGFKGAIVCSAHGGKESAFGYLKTVWIGITSLELKSYQIKSASWMPRGWKIELLEVNTENEVNAFRGSKVFAARHELRDLDEDTYFVGEVAGCQALDSQTNNPLGSILGVQEGRPDRWWIEANGNRFAILATKRYISRVDVKIRKVWLKNLEDYQ